MSAPAGYIELERTVDSIIVGRRHREDLGDLDPLVESDCCSPSRSPRTGG